ncbi:hypothetical protein AAFC00_004348 [Neodothiora populina]|uniref:Protein kinase domain-containing protein n=1 Tax=Neodothiora populina TaxID=2781224 RepID=A0ABR3PJS2_9PEZI
MGTRTFAQVPPTAATIALNAYIYGYAGHSLVTPHAALKQLWWTDDRIERKVTRGFVVSKIRGEERDFLNKPLGFGEGLTDDTYMDWILQRARRLFLILAELGKPEQIFGLIDDSLDDDDLPFTLESIRQLELSIEPDDRLNKQCYDTQFLFLLRQLKQGSHIDYGPNEHIPMEHVHKVPPAVPLQAWDRIHFPRDPERFFLRRKYVFGQDNSKETSRSDYLADIEKAKYLKHEHICPVYASYTAGDSGYVLSDFVPEHTLGSFIAQRLPYQFMRVTEADRPVLVLEWLHCLSDAIASLHHRGTYHGAIRPNNIIIDHDNRIAFSDIGSLRTFQKGKKIDKKEILEYAPPEVYTALTAPPLVQARLGAVGGRRRSSGDDSSTSSGSSRTNSIFSLSTITSPVSSPLGSQTSYNAPGTPKSPRGFRNFSRHLSQQSTISECGPLSEPINATPALPPEGSSPGRVTSLASIIATATSNITTITPSLPPPTPAEMSPKSPDSRCGSLWGAGQGAGQGRISDPSSGVSTPTRSTFSPALLTSLPTSPTFGSTKPVRSSSSPATTTIFPFHRSAHIKNNTPTLHKAPSTSTLPSLTTSLSHSSANQLHLMRTSTFSLPATILADTTTAALPNPEAADIFALGCIYLDVLTWLVKGRLNEFVKYRASPPAPGLLSSSAASTAASMRSVRSARSVFSYRSSPRGVGMGIGMGIGSAVGSSSNSSSGSSDGFGIGASSASSTGCSSAVGTNGPKTDTAYAAQLAHGKLELWISELRDESLKRLEDPKTSSTSASQSRPKSSRGASSSSSKRPKKSSSPESDPAPEPREEGARLDNNQTAIWVNGVPELLKLVKDMLSQEPEDRPSARQVRDRVEEVLGKGCGMRFLCCRGREWDFAGSGAGHETMGNGVGVKPTTSHGTTSDHTKSGAQQHIHEVDTDKGNQEAYEAGTEIGETEGLGIHMRSHRIDEAVETFRSGGVPVRRRIVNLPWRKKG